MKMEEGHSNWGKAQEAKQWKAEMLSEECRATGKVEMISGCLVWVILLIIVVGYLGYATTRSLF